MLGHETVDSVLSLDLVNSITQTDTSTLSTSLMVVKFVLRSEREGVSSDSSVPRRRDVSVVPGSEEDRITRRWGFHSGGVPQVLPRDGGAGRLPYVRSSTSQVNVSLEYLVRIVTATSIDVPSDPLHQK